MNSETKNMTNQTDFQKLQAKTKLFLEKIKTVVETPALHDKELLKTSLESVENLIEAFEQKLAKS